MSLRVLSIFLVAMASAFPAAAQTAKKFAGNGFGRGAISGDGFGRSINGLVQQSITGFGGSRGNIYSTFLAVETPVAVGITDRIQINGRRVVFQTDFDPDGCGCGVGRATGTASVSGQMIRYSARSKNGALRVTGTLRLTGRTITRTETRRQDGGVLKIRTTIFR